MKKVAVSPAGSVLCVLVVMLLMIVSTNIGGIESVDVYFDATEQNTYNYDDLSRLYFAVDGGKVADSWMIQQATVIEPIAKRYTEFILYFQEDDLVDHPEFGVVGTTEGQSLKAKINQTTKSNKGNIIRVEYDCTDEIIAVRQVYLNLRIG